jgi:uncharacterized damage-inducible protein DinB
VPVAVLQTMYVELALYNKWQNQVVYDICRELGEEAIELERPGLFFGTLRLTLDHIAHVDRVLIDFVRSGTPPTDFRPGEIQHSSFAELARHRPALDQEILDLVSSSTEEWLVDPIEFFSDRLGRRRRFPRTFLLTQMFNHQTHHRSQVTATVHSLGRDYGATDLPLNPLSQF